VRRPVFTSLSLLSLLLVFAAAAMDVRSYRVRDAWDGQKDHAGPAVYSNRGALVFVYEWRPPGPPELSDPGGIRVSAIEYRLDRSKRWSVPGLSWREHWLATDLTRPTDFSFRHQRTLVVRYWLVTVVTSILPMCWFIHCLRLGRRAARARRGLCRNCGYDLRASPQRCPECGTAVPGRGAPSAPSASPR
jgi:hypothetical protein